MNKSGFTLPNISSQLYNHKKSQLDHIMLDIILNTHCLFLKTTCGPSGNQEKLVVLIPPLGGSGPSGALISQALFLIHHGVTGCGCHWSCSEDEVRL